MIGRGGQECFPFLLVQTLLCWYTCTHTPEILHSLSHCWCWHSPIFFLHFLPQNLLDQGLVDYISLQIHREFKIRGKHVWQNLKHFANHLGCSLVCSGAECHCPPWRNDFHKTLISFRTMGLFTLKKSQQECAGPVSLWLWKGVGNQLDVKQR